MNDLYTRLHIYKLPDNGISMSLTVDNSFTLIGARYNEHNSARIKKEIEMAGCDRISLLHIPSWESTRCNSEEIKILLKTLSPLEIEIPFYEPTTEDAVECRKIIREYANTSKMTSLFEVKPKLIDEPTELEDITFSDVFISPMQKSKTPLGNSIIKYFWQGAFSFLNLGDSTNIDSMDYFKTVSDLASQKVYIVAMTAEQSKNFDEWLDKTSPNIVILFEDKVNVLLRKGVSLRNEGINILLSPDSDIIITRGKQKNEHDLIDSSSPNVDKEIYKEVQNKNIE